MNPLKRENVASNDDWEDESAFDDLTPAAAPIPMNGKLMECVSTDVIKPKGRLKLVLNMVDVETGEEALYYVNNAQQLKHGRIKVGKKSEVAKLYRLTHGSKNQHRHHEFNQLIKHFVGYRFVCEVAQALYSNGDRYLKVISCQPASPIYDDTQYTRTGELRHKSNHKPAKIQQKANNDQTKNQQKTNKNLTVVKGYKSHEHLVQSTMPTNDKWLMANELMVNGLIPNPLEKYQTPNCLGGYDFMRMPQETMDQLYERVLDATF